MPCIHRVSSQGFYRLMSQEAISLQIQEFVLHVPSMLHSITASISGRNKIKSSIDLYHVQAKLVVRNLTCGCKLQGFQSCANLHSPLVLSRVKSRRYFLENSRHNLPHNLNLTTDLGSTCADFQRNSNCLLRLVSLNTASPHHLSPQMTSNSIVPNFQRHNSHACSYKEFYPHSIYDHKQMSFDMISSQISISSSNQRLHTQKLRCIQLEGSCSNDVTLLSICKNYLFNKISLGLYEDANIEGILHEWASHNFS